MADLYAGAKWLGILGSTIFEEYCLPFVILTVRHLDILDVNRHDWLNLGRKSARQLLLRLRKGELIRPAFIRRRACVYKALERGIIFVDLAMLRVRAQCSMFKLPPSCC